MSSPACDIKFRFPDWAKRVKSRKQEILLALAASIQTNRGMLFDAEGAHNGHNRWPALKLRDGMILSSRGVLRRSIAPMNPSGRPGVKGVVTIAGEEVSIGTTIAYARMMNNGTVGLPGGVLRPKKAGGVLRIPLPQGDKANENAKDIQRSANNRKIAQLQFKFGKARKDTSKARLRAQISRLRNMNAKGKGPVRFLFVRSVKIEPRPFDKINETDRKEFTAAVRNKVLEILNGG